MQKHIIIVNDEWFKSNLDTFTNIDHCKVVRSFVKDELFKDDELHKKLMKVKNKASKEFYDYEFNIRNK